MRNRARLHLVPEPAPVEQARIDEMEDMAAAGEMLERLEERKRATEARNLARLLRRPARQHPNE